MHGAIDHIRLLLVAFLPSAAAMSLAFHAIIIGLILHILIKLEVLKPIILEYIMRDGLVLVDLIHKLLEVVLIVLLLLEVEDDGAADEGGEDGELVLHLLELLAERVRLEVALLVLQLVGVQLLPAHLKALAHRVVALVVPQLLL